MPVLAVQEPLPPPTPSFAEKEPLKTAVAEVELPAHQDAPQPKKQVEQEPLKKQAVVATPPSKEAETKKISSKTPKNKAKPAPKKDNSRTQQTAPAKKPAAKAVQKNTQTQQKESRAREEAAKKAEREKELARQEKQRAELQKREEAERKAEEQRVAKRKEALSTLQGHLDKMQETRTTARTASHQQGSGNAEIAQIGSLESERLSIDERTWGTQEMRYRDKVAHCLQQAISFPDYGMVQIRLVLDRKGNVKQLAVLKSASEKNRALIEKEVRKMHFPPLEAEFAGLGECALVITLENR